MRFVRHTFMTGSVHAPLVLLYHGVPLRGCGEYYKCAHTKIDPLVPRSGADVDATRCTAQDTRRHPVASWENTLPLNANAFEQHISFLERNCTFIRPEEYATVRGSLRRPATLLTFDDGLRNNAEVVAPILHRHHIPAVFFISSRHCAPGKYLWSNYFQMLETYFPGNSVTLNGEFIPLRGTQRGARIRKLREDLLALKPHPNAMYAAIETQLPPLESFTSAVVRADECEGMTVEQVRGLGADPLFTVGAHTLDHPYLTRCEPREAERQMYENKSWLESITGNRCDLFAYPMADFDSNTVEACRRVGFQRAFGVARQEVSPAEFAIRRVGVYSKSLVPLGIKLWFGHWLPIRLMQKVRMVAQAPDKLFGSANDLFAAKTRTPR
jgi:peptidoglycan/xylan/chitin deacetylase (PgdA/CDA1 family)